MNTTLIRGSTAFAIACAVLGLTSAGMAAIPTSDFPTVKQAKSAMNGTGQWGRWVLDRNEGAPIGAKPSRCRSDLPFRAADEFRTAVYFGPVAGQSDFGGTVHDTVYHFASTKKAKHAMAGVTDFLTACPRSVEWVCEQCDGIWTAKRTVLSVPTIGAQSIAWNEKRSGMGLGNGRAIASRRKDTITVTFVMHGTSPEIVDEYPPRPTVDQAVQVARDAGQAAHE